MSDVVVDEGEAPQLASEDPAPPALFKCQQCRNTLFKSADVIPHLPDQTRKIAGKRREYGGEQCTSYFIEKPDWLNALGRKSDTVYCPKCHYKIGHFSWIGCQCSCGEWVKPAFQIIKSRIDQCSPQ
jgi:hypothetical protein